VVGGRSQPAAGEQGLSGVTSGFLPDKPASAAVEGCCPASPNFKAAG